MTTAFRDRINLLSKLNFKRLRNLLGVYLSYHFSGVRRNSWHPSMPSAVSIEPTTSCNLRCPECPSGLRSFSRPTGMLNLNLFKSVLDQIKDSLFYLTLYFQGEPFLNKDLFEMIRYAKSRKIYVATSTNAHFLDEECARKTVESGIDRLIVSIDGTTQGSYEKYRIGGELEKVLQGVRNINSWKGKISSASPFLILQFIIFKHNEHEISEMKKLGKELNVDKVVFKTAQVYDFSNGNELIPKNKDFARYEQNDTGNFTIKNRLENRCWKLWHSCVITWDGSLVPCCFDKDAKHVMGNLKYESFKEIWQGEQYRKFRNNLLKNRNEIEICRNCTEGTRIWAEV